MLLKVLEVLIMLKLQLKDTEYAIKNIVKQLLSELRGLKFVKH